MPITRSFVFLLLQCRETAVDLQDELLKSVQELNNVRTIILEFYFLRC